MKAVLLTDLERAVIDRLRKEHYSMQHAVLSILDLPDTGEIYEYMERIEDDKTMPQIIRERSAERLQQERARQEKALRRFRAEGYGDALQIRTEKAAPYLQARSGRA